MELVARTHVDVRDNFGRFAAACDAAATRTVEDAVERGAALSRSIAPSGKKRDPRTVKLKASISSRMLSSRSGEWSSNARHALPIEFGATGHPISGALHFWWEREGRWFTPNPPDFHATVHHPGNKAQPFLRPAQVLVMREVLGMAMKNYPG